MTVANYNKSTLIERRCKLLFAGLLSRRSLSGLRFGAFFERGFARKLDPAFVVDADAFDPDHVADFCDVLRSFDAEIRKLGNVDEAVLAWENFDKGAELFHGNDAALISLADLDFARHAGGTCLRARLALGARGVCGH